LSKISTFTSAGASVVSNFKETRHKVYALPSVRNARAANPLGASQVLPVGSLAKLLSIGRRTVALAVTAPAKKIVKTLPACLSETFMALPSDSVDR
jgi:hypothetical protein